MIPLRDDNPTRTFPIVTVLLILANVLVYIYQVFGPLGPLFNAEYAMVPGKVTSGQDLVGIVQFTQSGVQIFHHLAGIPPSSNPNEIFLGPTPIPLWMTIFTAMFMHASLLHIGGNMLFLWIFGNNVEDALGKGRFLFFYLFCGLTAAAAQILVDPNSLIPTLGASGAIAGVLGAYIVMYPDARVLTLFIVGLIFLREVSAFWVLLIWIGLQVIEGITHFGGMATGGVAYMAHIGGFFSGLVIITLLGGRSLGARQRVSAQSSPYGF